MFASREKLIKIFLKDLPCDESANMLCRRLKMFFVINRRLVSLVGKTKALLYASRRLAFDSRSDQQHRENDAAFAVTSANG